MGSNFNNTTDPASGSNVESPLARGKWNYLKEMLENIFTLDLSDSALSTFKNSWVKTAHIQDSAVTSTKIADAAVTQSKLGSDVVFGSVFGFKGPTSIGSGSTAPHEGVVTISSNTNLAGVHFYTTLTINSGVTVTVPSGGRCLVLIASDSITVNGSINSVGAGAPGEPARDSPIKSDTELRITRAGTDQAGGGGSAGNGNTTGQGGHCMLNYSIVAVAGGDAATPSSNIGSNALRGFSLFQMTGGAGGGSGGGNGAGYSNGSGGAGGGTIILMAPTITLGSGSSINASGANGVAGVNNTVGSGGGGGSGNVYIITSSFNDNGGSIITNGGSGGIGGKSNGYAGANGFKQIFISS